MITLIDNYDSFTYNIYHSICKNGHKVNVIKNDKLLENYNNILQSQAIVISPGPSNPYEAGECLDLLDKIYSFIPILGICLGHQIIGAYFKGTIKTLKVPFHGKVSRIVTKKNFKIFEQISENFLATRYHSLYIDYKTLPRNLKITCMSRDDKIIMGLKHELYNIYGIQFHPESIETANGDQIIENFLNTI